MIIRRSRAGDMALSPDGSQFVEIGGSEWTETKIGLRLGFWLSEWFLNALEGMPYIQEILGKKTPVPIIRSIFWDALQETDGVSSVLEVDVVLDNSSRELSVTWAVILLDGTISRPGKPFIIPV